MFDEPMESSVLFGLVDNLFDEGFVVFGLIEGCRLFGFLNQIT